MPKEAWFILSEESNSYLIDVRTKAELALGKPDLSIIGKKLIELEWRKASDGLLNPFFIEGLSKLVGIDDKLIFLCKVGGRSQDAANLMFANGYKNCYNVKHGFCDGTAFSWQSSNLPWS